jgi:FtsP/CotA-like multicopper oxidase with cupredoxin domain
MGVGQMMGMNHNFHMHATHFRVLERDGEVSKVRPWERGYKDTVFLAPRERVKLLVRHTDYSDDRHPYMYHCHILEHEDAGMIGQFTVV